MTNENTSGTFNDDTLVRDVRSGGDEFDRYLLAGHDRLLAHLDARFDLDAGLAEILRAQKHRDLVTVLDRELDVEAGLTAVLKGGSRSTPSRSEASVDAVPATSTTPSDHRLTIQLKSLTDLERLRLRALPSYCQLRRVLALVPNLDLAYELACTLDHAHNLANTRDLPRDLAHARDLAYALDRARDLGHALDRAYTRDLAHAQALDLAAARDLARDHEIARDLARDLDRARIPTRALAAALAPALAITPATSLAHTIARTIAARTIARTIARALASALARARDLARDLARNRDDTIGRALHLTRELARDLNLELDPNLTSMEITTMLEGLIEIADNFVGADLRAAANFDSTEWAGIRWSPATAWPPGWEDRVRAISVKIEPEIFEVAHGPTQLS